MVVYISGAMTGIENNNKEAFDRAEAYLTNKGYKVINPAHLFVYEKALTDEDLLKIDLALMNFCDTIYMLKGWRKSCGANREYGYALAKNMVVLFE